MVKLETAPGYSQQKVYKIPKTINELIRISK